MISRLHEVGCWVGPWVWYSFLGLLHLPLHNIKPLRNPRIQQSSAKHLILYIISLHIKSILTTSSISTACNAKTKEYTKARTLTHPLKSTFGISQKANSASPAGKRNLLNLVTTSEWPNGHLWVLDSCLIRLRERSCSSPQNINQRDAHNIVESGSLHIVCEQIVSGERFRRGWCESSSDSMTMYRIPSYIPTICVSLTMSQPWWQEVFLCCLDGMILYPVASS